MERRHPGALAADGGGPIPVPDFRRHRRRTEHRARARPRLFADTFPAEALLGITVESERLAAAYMERHILPPRYTDDARHVAVCTVTQLEYLVSWNFKHLVNVEREKGFNAVNLLQGYRPIRIVNPLELIYGHQDQSL